MVGWMFHIARKACLGLYLLVWNDVIAPLPACVILALELLYVMTP